MLSYRGKSDVSDSNHTNSAVFNYINGQIYLLALYRDDQLRVWSMSNFQCVCSFDCIRDNNKARTQGRKFKQCYFVAISKNCEIMHLNFAKKKKMFENTSFSSKQCST